MDYKKIYNQLMDRARNCACHGYSEKHHIVPRCMGGTDTDDNLVELRPEEHYLAHQLLVKMYPSEHGLWMALRFLAGKGSKRKHNNKTYGWINRGISKAGQPDDVKAKISAAHKKLPPKSEETRKKMSESAKARCTPEWREWKSKSYQGKPGTKGSTGMKDSEETKMKKSLAHKARWAIRKGGV